MQDKNARSLFEKYQLGKYTPEEQAFIENYILSLDEPDTQLSEEEILQVIGRLREKVILPVPEKSTVKLWPRIAVAAVVLFAISTCFYLVNRFAGKDESNFRIYANDIAPGSSKATLTLANGKKINLTDANAGEIASQSGIEITKTADGQIVYKVKGDSNESLTNIVATPNGGQYVVCLSDGTKVWLNAASTLKFPVSFTGASRDVELSGEAYFEVAKDKKKPFNVTSNMQRVQVLGTHFNIRNYVSESIAKTTLLEGSVKVSALTGASNATLQPGMQSILANNVMKAMAVDTEEAIAWKNGLFMFDEEPLESIMDDVSRWYDVEVIYEDQGIKQTIYWGTINKFKNVSELLKALELSGKVHFEINGRKIIVSN
jgi:transmembrane sensor